MPQNPFVSFEKNNPCITPHANPTAKYTDKYTLFCALVKELEGITFTQGSLSHVANTMSSLERWGQIKYKTDGKQVLQLHVGWAGRQHNVNSKFFSICIIVTISSDLW